MISCNKVISTMGYPVLDDKKVAGRRCLADVKNLPAGAEIKPEDMIRYFGIDGAAALTFDALCGKVRKNSECWWAAPGEVYRSSHVMLLGGSATIEAFPESADRLKAVWNISVTDKNQAMWEKAARCKISEILSKVETMGLSQLSERATYLKTFLNK